MPKLTDQERESINSRLRAHEAIMSRFRDKQYVSSCCRFCNWASNGLTLDEAWDANQKHEKTHQEYDEWETTEISLRQLQRSWHDHDCEMGLCQCKCGCRQGPFCHTVLGSLCGVCLIREQRGDSEHGLNDVVKETEAI